MKSKNKFPLFQTFTVLVCTVFIFLSCTKNEIDDAEVNLDGVYVAGTTFDGIKYFVTIWENGVEKRLTNGLNDVTVTGLFVNNNDVYVTWNIIEEGWEKACVWKNGELIDYATGGNSSTASAIYVYNNDVFIVGERIEFYPELFGSDRMRFDMLVWKNGTINDTILENTGSYSTRSIFVRNNNVYVSANLPVEIDNMGFSVGNIWKNGELLYTLMGGNGQRVAYSIFVDDEENVYAAGFSGRDYSTATLWKNGIPTNLSVPSNTSDANSVFVNDGIVYAAGVDEYEYPHYAAVYWKDSQKVILSKKAASANSIYVKDGQVYICGTEHEEGSQHATIWLNGKSRRLSSEYSSTAVAIFVAN